MKLISPKIYARWERITQRRTNKALILICGFALLAVFIVLIWFFQEGIRNHIQTRTRYTLGLYVFLIVNTGFAVWALTRHKR